MHIRRGRYIGVAPMPGGLTNVCLVRPSRPGDADLRDPAALLRASCTRDPLLRDRAAGARLAAPPVVLGPLAVDATGAGARRAAARRRRGGLHRSDDRRRPALRRPRRRAGGGRGAARARARLDRRPRSSLRPRDGARVQPASGASTARCARSWPRHAPSMSRRFGARVAPVALRRVIEHAGDCDTIR